VGGATLLARLTELPSETAILLDVDGTLAPIVPRPEDAHVPGATRAELERLAGRYALVACLSGRTGEDAARVVGVPGLLYVGEHGLELEAEADEWAQRLAAFARTVPWSPEEGKRLTLSFHFRASADPEGARAELEAVAARALEQGLRPRFGRMVLEVRPPVDADKGTAVSQLLSELELKRALYAGDDTTDLDAFRALDELELGVRVAVASEEGPAELVRTADLVVESPEELAKLLRRL
jgi:trehalose 6-phosphate phosphatase